MAHNYAQKLPNPLQTSIDWLAAEGYTAPQALISVVSFFVVASLLWLGVDIRRFYFPTPSHLARRTWTEIIFKPRPRIPRLNPRTGSNDYVELLRRGTRLYPNIPYRIPHHPHEWVVIPPNMIDELRNLPSSTLDLQQASYDIWLGVHTSVASHNGTVGNYLRSGPNRIVDLTWPAIAEEANRSVKSNFGHPRDWTSIKLLPKTVAIVLVVAQRMFVGEPLCHDPQWLNANMQVMQNAFGSVPSLWPYKELTRPLAAYRNKNLRLIHTYWHKATDMLAPVLARRLAAMSAPDFKPPPDVLQSVLDTEAKTKESRSVEYQISVMLGLGRATLFTTGITLFFLLYDLAAHPEYVGELRAELEELGDAPLNRAKVAKLSKLDSFIKESQRFNKTILLGTHRKVKKPVVLSDGTVLPVGTYIATDTRRACFDASMLEKPEVFDGLRYHRMRMETGKEGYQSVQTAADHLVYGMGSQACPGRFVAAHLMKVVLVELLRGYDVRVKREDEDHPMRRFEGLMVVPDREREVEIRVRE